METKNKFILSVLIAGAFTVSLSSAVSAKRLHDPQVETKVEMQQTLQQGTTRELPAGVNSTAKGRSLSERIQDILHPAVQPSLPVQNIPGLSVQPSQADDDSILGTPLATREQCVKYLLSINPHPNLTVTPEALVSYYYEEGQREGIRPDVAFAQALKETGYFSYGGTVTPDQNNYCGLGTTSATVKGAYFPNSQLGVRAHIQHLLAYASTRRPAAPVVDPRYDLVRSVYGDSTLGKWEDLNGRWAVPGYTYGQSIMQLFNNILKEH